jgi:release factor glutamine methyltransferase
MTTGRELLEEGRRRLAARGRPSPGREAALLLRHVLGLDESALLARDRQEVAAGAERRFRDLLARREAGTPVAYLTGEREFWGRAFQVDSRVLVPRPETEHLVEIALALPLPERARVLDVGTGSGCLAVTLAAERPVWRVVAVDRSAGALAVARSNARRHGVAARVVAVAGDLLAGLDAGRFDLVVANLPYVDPGERDSLSPEVVDHEPAAALFAGRHGLALVERLIDEAGAALAAGAWLACEIGAGQAAPLLAHARRTGRFTAGEARPDLAGVERDLVWRRI